MAQDWATDVKKYDADADDGAIAGLVKYLGIALRKPDSALVAMSDSKETGRVRDNFLKKKLGLSQADADLDAAIKRVGERMKADRTKNRVTVYYLLAKEFGKLDAFATRAKVPAKTAAAKPVVKAPVAAKAPATKAAPSKKAAPKTAAAKPAVAKSAAPKPAARATTDKSKATKAKAQTLAQPVPAPTPAPSPTPTPAPAAAKPQPATSTTPGAAKSDDAGGSTMWLLWVLLALVAIWLIWKFVINNGA